MDDAALATIRRFRALPASSTVLVSPGDVVEPDTPIARTEVLQGKLWRVDVARDLRVSRAEVLNRLVARPGDKVLAGGVVAAGGSFFNRLVSRSPVKGVLALVSKSRGAVYIREQVETDSSEGPVEVPVAKMLGISPLAIMVYKNADAAMGICVVRGQTLARVGKTAVQSPMYGRITGISPVKGTITITPMFKTQVIPAYIRGSIETVIPSEGIEVCGTAKVIRGTWGLGGESHGCLQVFIGDLTPELALTRGSVVVASGTATYEALMSAAESGVKGVVLGWLRSGIAMRLAGGVKNMGVTGDEAAPFPLILTEGFLPEIMKDQVYRILADSEGSLCSLTGSTHIRAGVVRPEILIFSD